MLKRPVTTIRLRKRGTTRFLTGSTPSTWRASSSSRILRAPRSAGLAVPAPPARGGGGVEPLAEPAGAEVGGDGRAGHAGQDDRGDERRELADRREDEEAAQPVDR